MFILIFGYFLPDQFLSVNRRHHLEDVSGTLEIGVVVYPIENSVYRYTIIGLVDDHSTIPFQYPSAEILRIGACRDLEPLEYWIETTEATF